MNLTEKDIDRLWTKIEERGPDECWPWLASCNLDGYGHLRLNGKLERAHRVVWFLTYGTIPEGMCVCHHCDNPPCCNPAHLFLGTQIDNIHDRDAKGRGNFSLELGYTIGRRFKPGHKFSPTKFTDDEKREIKRKVVEGVRNVDIAKKYDISQQSVSDIKCGRIWKNV